MPSTKFYPFLSSSLYTASFAISSSYANSATYLDYVATASMSTAGNFGPPGLRGNPDICFITTQQYFDMLFSSSLQEFCTFPIRDAETQGGA